MILEMWFPLVLLFALKAAGATNNKDFNDATLRQGKGASANDLIDVVSHSFCESSLLANDKMAKKTLQEVHTYASLKLDQKASLPDSFTVCSTIRKHGCQSDIWPTFFSILGTDDVQFLGAIRNHNALDTHFEVLFSNGTTGAEAIRQPPFFPNQWTRSCMAVNMTSGIVQWVVDGTLVLETISEELINAMSRPRDLSGRLILGARSIGSVWFASSHEVTNVNIFSSLLPIEKMKSMTEGGSCNEEGDYLAWKDMEWVLQGQARQGKIEKDKPCQREPYFDLYNTKFPSMATCMHHCQNLGTRAPSVASSQLWLSLQRSLKAEVFDK